MKTLEQISWFGTALMALLASLRMLNLWLTSTASALSSGLR